MTFPGGETGQEENPLSMTVAKLPVKLCQYNPLNFFPHKLQKFNLSPIKLNHRSVNDLVSCITSFSVISETFCWQLMKTKITYNRGTVLEVADGKLVGAPFD